MKKLFTLLAFLTCFVGAKAEWVTDYSVDYSTYQKFPFYVMGYVPEWYEGVMTDLGANYKYVAMATKDNDGNVTYSEETSDVIIDLGNGDDDTKKYYRIALDSPGWHQYFIADGISTELGGSYTVKALVKASEACTINVNMGWGWGDGQQASASVQIPASDEFQEVEWSYTEIGGTSCNLVAQPGTTTAKIEWKSLTVSHNQKQQAAVEWLQQLTNGDAEAAWPSWATEGEPNETWKGDRTGEICAWGKVKGKNLGPNFKGDGEGYNPFPAEITDDPDKEGNHVFVVHAALADTEGDASAWDNQFWIQSPKAWKSGTQIRVKFRYKASVDNVKTNTQIHKQNPSEYLIWYAIDDVTFTTQWQDFEKTITFDDAQAGGWSIAFNLNAVEKNPIDFYFDDLSWEIMKLDEGLFVAGENKAAGLEYDYANAVKFEGEDPLFTATIGEKGNKDSWVNEVMISTIRGNDAAFKGATLKVTGTVTGDEDDWYDYTEGSLAKVKLPAAGVWEITVNTKFKKVNFSQVEGDEIVIKQAVDVVTNNTAIVVKGQERDDLADGKDNDGNVVINEEEGGTGQAWDNQFFIKANRALEKGEVTILKFKYKSSVDAKTTTQCHGETPGAYMHWAAIGDVNFTTEWQDFEKEFTIPNEGDGMWNIAFNMAEIRQACDYEITDVQWYLKYDEEGKTMENLINETGTSNFFVKEGAGTNPYEFGTDPSGIINVKKDAVKANDAIFNLAGQRVSKDYKGIVVKNGKKYITK